MSEALFLANSIQELHKAISAGSLSPMDIAEECISRVNELEDRCKAWVVFHPEILRVDYKKIESRLTNGGVLRDLEAIPIGVKDIYNTVEYPTAMGSPIWQDFTPGNDARVVYNMERAGAVVAGKTVTAEFAVHALGKTLHPYDALRNPGTSSSGSAVAVATGMVPVALGTQTAGSTVRPASYCGVYGCKPSFGLIPRTGMLKTTDSLDSVGFFTAFAEDLRRVFDSIRVWGPNYPISDGILNDHLRQNKQPGHPWRVALVKPHIWGNAYPHARETLVKWANTLNSLKDVEVFELTLPDEMSRSHQIHATIYNRCLSYYFEEEYKKAELVSPIMKQLIEDGSGIDKDTFIAALQDQQNLCTLMDNAFENCDIIVTLSTAGEAPLRDDEEPPDSALMWTMTHLPVVSAPVFSSPDGLPFGLQIVARGYNDYLLFNFLSYLLAQGMVPDSPKKNGQFSLIKYGGLKV